MINSDLLSSGSINGFIEGKNFNRCKRLHPIVSMAIQMLHFKSFLNKKNIELNDDIKIFFEEFKNKRSENRIYSNSIAEIHRRYQSTQKKI